MLYYGCLYTIWIISFGRVSNNSNHMFSHSHILELKVTSLKILQIIFYVGTYMFSLRFGIFVNEIITWKVRQLQFSIVWEYFVPLSSIHYHSTRLATSKNLFLPRVNSSSGKCSLKCIGPKVWSSIPDDIKLSTTFTFKWKLKRHLLHENNSHL